ncbi:hypothetical protein [Actinoplanes sp. NPDC051851]
MTTIPDHHVTAGFGDPPGPTYDAFTRACEPAAGSGVLSFR